MRLQRVLYIANGNGLSSSLGGSIVRTGNIARCLKDAGHHVHLMTTCGGLRAFTELGTRIPHTIVRASLLAARERSTLFRLWSYTLSALHGSILARRMSGYDWVYSDSDYPCDVIPALSHQRAWGSRWVAMLHHLVEAESATGSAAGKLKRELQRWVHRIIAAQADLVFCYATEAGDCVSDELVSLGMDPARIRRVHNGYDSAEIQGIRPADATYDACFVGVLRPGKGLHEIVPIWSRVCALLPQAHLCIVGAMQPENRKILDGGLASAGLHDNVTVLGSRTHQEALAVVKASRVMIAPSLEEGWGIAVCEALAAGVPVIAYEIPAFRSLFRGGMHRVPLGDRMAFADRAVEVLSDCAMYEALRTEAREAVRGFEWCESAKMDASFLEEYSNMPARSGGVRSDLPGCAINRTP